MQKIITFLSAKIGLWFNAEPAETRPRSNFPESRVAFPRLNTDETILMAGTEYFGQTVVTLRAVVSRLEKPLLAG